MDIHFTRHARSGLRARFGIMETVRCRLWRPSLDIFATKREVAQLANPPIQYPMKNPIRFTTILCLLALALLPFPATFAGDVQPQVVAAQLSPGDQVSTSNEKLIERLKEIADASPGTKAFGQNVVSAGAAAETNGQFLDIERDLMQMKMALATNKEAVGIIEQLLSRFQIADAAAKAKRQEQLNSLVKELTDKFNSHASLNDYDDLLKRITDLETSSIDTIYGRSGQVDTQRMENVRSFVAQWQDYLAASQAGNSQRAATAIGQLVQLSAQFTAIPRSVLINIQNTPVVDTSNERELALAKTEFDKISAKLVGEIDAAKVPSDLDAALAELGASHPSTTQYGQYQNVNRIENLKMFARKWQEYLAAKQSGNYDRMMSAIRELANTNYDASFYPRSKILSLQQNMTHVDKNLAKDGVLMDPKFLTLHNLRDLSDQLNSLNSQSGNPSYLMEHHEMQLQYAVSRLEGTLNMVKAGDNKSGILATQDLQQTIGQTGDYLDVLYSLYEQVAFNALRAEIEVPDDLKPAPQEHFGAFLERVETIAVDRKDWRLAYRAAEVRRDLGQRVGNFGDEMQDFDGFHSMIQGFNLDEAGQWTDAVVAYKNALDTTGPHVPVKEIGERLARIKREHPDDYQKGLSLPDYSALLAKALEMREASAHPPREQNLKPGIPGPTYGAPTNGFPDSKIQLPASTATGR
jgi:hypothetical protein